MFPRPDSTSFPRGGGFCAPFNPTDSSYRLLDQLCKRAEQYRTVCGSMEIRTWYRFQVKNYGVTE